VKSRSLTQGAATRLRETHHLSKTGRCPHHRVPSRKEKAKCGFLQPTKTAIRDIRQEDLL